MDWASTGRLQDIVEARKRLASVKEQEKEILDRIKFLEGLGEKA